MTKRELEILGKLLNRANPPPILYRYRGPTQWTLKEIEDHELFAASPNDLNDPFECSAPVAIDLGKVREKFIEFHLTHGRLSREEAAREFDSGRGDAIPEMLLDGIKRLQNDRGIICFSAIPNSIRMWSYYAQSHEGICIGFNSSFGPFIAAMKVLYENPTIPLDVMEALKSDPSLLAAHVTLRKASEWEFEQEYRIPIGQIGTRSRLFPYNPQAITEIRFGARIKDDFRLKMMKAITHLPNPPKLIQMGVDLDRFVLTETEIQI